MPTVNWCQRLREVVAVQSTAYAKTLPAGTSYLSLGHSNPTRLYTPFSGVTRHGNFCDASYTAILAAADWKRRLDKPHQRKSALPHPQASAARELDSSNSSDALLMNIFCYPGVLSAGLADLLKVDPRVQPEFGFKAGVPLASTSSSGRSADQTEVDLKLDDLLIEAKFTEKDFTTQNLAIVNGYRDLATVFDVPALPRVGANFASYQLIRNVLAAHHHQCRFWLLCDARRPDLLRAWWEIYGAIKLPALRARCGFVLWQEIAAVVPDPLSDYLRNSRAIV